MHIKRRILAMVLSVSMLGSIIVANAEYTTTIDAFQYDGWDIPEYDGDLYEPINDNSPKFSEEEFTQDIYATYGELDDKGRVTTCYGNLDYTLFPTEPRGNISSVKPTGWIQKMYDFVNGKSLYNRSHLIMWALTGQNANRNNLMTGTRTFNTKGMLDNENKVLDYLKRNNENNALYRVTPVFQGDNLLASGVIMEAESVDDMGEALKYAVFVYNVEPGVALDYETGDSIDAAELTEEEASTEVVSTQATTERITAENIPSESTGGAFNYVTTESMTTSNGNLPNAYETDNKLNLTRQNQIITFKKPRIYKAKKLKKKKTTFKLNAKTTGDGNITYKIVKGKKKYISVSKYGKVTLKKRCKKGIYKVRITASKTDTYWAGFRTVIIRVK